MPLLTSSTVIRLVALAGALAAVTLSGCRSRSFHSQNRDVGAPGVDASAPQADGRAAARKGFTFNVMAPLTLPSTDAE